LQGLDRAQQLNRVSDFKQNVSENVRPAETTTPFREYSRCFYIFFSFSSGTRMKLFQDWRFCWKNDRVITRVTRTGLLKPVGKDLLGKFFSIEHRGFSIQMTVVCDLLYIVMCKFIICRLVGFDSALPGKTI